MKIMHQSCRLHVFPVAVAAIYFCKIINWLISRRECALYGLPVFLIRAVRFGDPLGKNHCTPYDPSQACDGIHVNVTSITLIPIPFLARWSYIEVFEECIELRNYHSLQNAMKCKMVQSFWKTELKTKHILTI